MNGGDKPPVIAGEDGSGWEFTWPETAIDVGWENPLAPAVYLDHIIRSMGIPAHLVTPSPTNSTTPPPAADSTS